MRINFMKTMTINGIDFEVIKPRDEVKRCDCGFGCANTIFHYYQRPSHIKELVWYEWLHWAYNTAEISQFNIVSANCMQFTISGLYRDTDGTLYNLRITRDHNRAIKLG